MDIGGSVHKHVEPLVFWQDIVSFEILNSISFKFSHSNTHGVGAQNDDKQA